MVSKNSNGVHALVIELVGADAGGSDRTGPIPLDEALPIAKQIAEASRPRMSKGSFTAI